MEPTTITDEQGVAVTTEFTTTCPCGETVTYSGGREQPHTCRPISAQQLRDAWAAGYDFARREAAMAATLAGRATLVLTTATVAPCGATYGTAAGPNDGRTRCGGCGEVHPVQYVHLGHLGAAAHTYTPACAGHHGLTEPCPGT